ncbi:fimbrillin family protein [Hoylesella timonensis]|uniref:fimbrillin family protein n=1 Tax=Hoylesella timonensis TaxID=386414 RepID=UPI00242FF8C9|nr:fimbrillin family protein [Hoylesella timonensis]
MKTFFLSYKAITAALTMCLAAITTSCSQDIENGNTSLDGNKAEGSKIVKLSFGPSTRGTMYDEISQMADNATFGVYGYARKDGSPISTEPNFINNGSALKKDGIVRVGGKVATYKENMPKVKLAAVYPKFEGENDVFTRTGDNTYTLTYTLQKDMAKQHDLLIGEAPEFTITSENSKNDVIDGQQTVNMHHALTAINFAIGDRIPTGYTIEGIRLKNLYTKGTCNVDLSKTTDAERFTWEDLSEKKDVYLKTNHITTTQINRTQFTGLKTGNKYDNLTIFMIPQPVGDDAIAEVVLKKDGKYGADGNIQEDSRLPLKLITIPLKLRDDKPYTAGQVEKYNIGAKPPQEDLNPLLYFITKTGRELTSSSAYNLKTDADKEETTKEGATKYDLTIFSARYVAKTKSQKSPIPLIVAPHTFRIVKITYDYYQIKDGKKDRCKNVEVPEGSVVVGDIKQPDSNDKNGHFTLTFNPKYYPKVQDLKIPGKKGRPDQIIKQSFDKIQIHIELDGAVMTLKQAVKGFPQQ